VTIGIVLSYIDFVVDQLIREKKVDRELTGLQVNMLTGKKEVRMY